MVDLDPNHSMMSQPGASPSPMPAEMNSQEAILVEEQKNISQVNSQLGDLTKHSSRADVSQAVQLPRRLLAKTKTDKTNSLAVNNVYDFVGSNKIFQASPAVVKFAGFETGKTHTLKVRLINNSPAPQRLHVLPPQTPYFKIRYNKKGMVPTGVSEDIYVQFTPARDQGYKYYYDTIRIHCEGDKILIPVHAFPVINSKRPSDELFPSLIDLGRNCKLGSYQSKELQIESNCPLSFEFQIEVTKPHPEIKISPHAGDIIGEQTTSIKFEYVPKTLTTAECEIKVRTSEFDSQPKTVRIVGSAQANLLDKNDAEQIWLDQAQTPQFEATKTLLMGSRGGPARLQLSKLPEKYQTGKDDVVVKTDNTLINLKNVKLTEAEQKFIKEYRRLEDLEREKGIKFFQCVGDEPHTEEFTHWIEETRANLECTKQNNMRKRDCTRFTTETDSDMVVVDTTAGRDITNQPKWDHFENNHFAMRRRLVGIFLRVSNKLISQLRAGKRLMKIKQFIDQNEIKSRDDMKRCVAADHKRAINMQLTDGDESQKDDIKNVAFEFRFNSSFIKNSMSKLPLEYETNMASFMEKVEANPCTNFDDLTPFEPLEMLDFEVENYQPFPIPQMSYFDPAELDKSMRPGCQYESIIRQRAGEPDLEKTQMEAHEQMALLKQDKKDIVSGAIVQMPASFLKPLDYSVDLVLRGDRHPTLREYIMLPASSSTEVDPEFALYPLKRTRIEQKDEYELKNQVVAKKLGGQPGLTSATYTLGLSKTVSGCYVNNLDVPTQLLPGNFGVRILDGMMPTSLSDVYRERRSTAVQSFVCDQHTWRVPEIMPNPSKVDYLTDEESEGDNMAFDLKVPKLQDLITEFEKDDDVLHKAEEELEEKFGDLKARGFEKGLRDEIVHVKSNKVAMFDANISAQRAQYASVLPGMLEDLNQVIQKPTHKIYLR